MKIHRFGREDPLAEFHLHPQASYLRCYLSDLKAAWVVEETRYFDRDYLEEYSVYYASVAAAGYPGVCRRLHFFGEAFTTQALDEALGGGSKALDALQATYLGFAVIRPLPHAPLGRTVVKWYPDEPARYGGNQRIVPARDYGAHLAGLPLRVSGLAWQQQDGAVALCATTALWSMLHSSAFDDHHAIPTTTEVTRFAFRPVREGGHVFPALDGLDNRQILEAIARARLNPVLIDGDATDGFSQESFSTAVATLIRSGYPVLLSGVLQDRGGHVVCLTGFRSRGGGSPHQDAGVEVFYVHDDNLGPNVREQLELDEEHRVTLRPAAPAPRYEGEKLYDPAADYHAFRPEQLIVGVHEGLRMPPTHLNRIAVQLVETMQDLIESTDRITATVRFSKVPAYAGTILGDTLKDNADGLRAVRKKIVEALRPMGLHLGVIRIGAPGQLIADVLVDATDVAHLDAADSSSWWRAFGTVVFSSAYEEVLMRLSEEVSLGELLTDASA